MERPSSNEGEPGILEKNVVCPSQIKVRNTLAHIWSCYISYVCILSAKKIIGSDFIAKHILARGKSRSPPDNLIVAPYTES